MEGVILSYILSVRDWKCFCIHITQPRIVLFFLSLRSSLLWSPHLSLLFTAWALWHVGKASVLHPGLVPV